MTAAPSPLYNPLASVQQLETSASSLAGLTQEDEESVRYETSRLIQAAGIMLRMPQDLIAQSIVLLCRSLTGIKGASFLDADASIVAAAALYLAAKPSGHTLTPRLLLLTIEYLAATGPRYDAALHSGVLPAQWSFSEGKYESQRSRLYEVEARMLRTLGFDTHVALPYTVCINYMQTLEVFETSQGTVLAKRAFEHLNSALFSPQLLYLTFQPTTLAVAAIYLAAREVGLKLPETEWWEVFDVDREDLGFVVVALLSLPKFVDQETEKWSAKQSLLTTDALKQYIQREDS